jgi:hypothetical protein
VTERDPWDRARAGEEAWAAARVRVKVRVRAVDVWEALWPRDPAAGAYA